ncbi:MAG: BLUF domain-containing protein [Gillisia sp.]
MNYAICYVSTANKSLEPTQVTEILDQTEARNNQIGIRGFLIYSEGNFFEVLEGEEQMIKELFLTIKDDHRHKNIIIIFEKICDKELFEKEDAEVGFISQSTEFRKIKLENFYECIINLDKGTQSVVKKILTQFGKNAPNEGNEQEPGKDNPDHTFLY